MRKLTHSKYSSNDRLLIVNIREKKLQSREITDCSFFQHTILFSAYNVSFVNDHIPKLFLLGGEQIHICHINSHVSEDNANIIGLINDKQNMSDKLDLIFKYTVTNKLGLTVTQNNKLQIQSKLLMNLVTTNGEFDSNKFESFKQTYASKLKMMNIQIGKDVITQYNSLKNDRKYDHIDKNYNCRKKS